MKERKEQVGGDRRDYYRWIQRTLDNFYRSFHRDDMLKFYSFFDADFQRKVPLNLFLYHPNYNLIELGEYKGILDIKLSQFKDRGDVKIQIKERGNIVSINIKIKKEYGDWKIIGEDFF